MTIGTLLDPERWRWNPFSRVRPSESELEDPGHDPKAVMYRHPGSPAAAPPKRVCIIGGGIAGLAAAYELTDGHPHSVAVFEATHRWGGRVLTHYFPDGTYGELGAMRVPDYHECVWHYVNQFGLDQKRRRFWSYNEDGYCLFRDSGRLRRFQWDAAGPQLFGVSTGSRPKTAKRMIDEVGLAATINREEVWEGLSNKITSEHLSLLEAVPLGTFVAGATKARAKQSLTDQQWEYAGLTTNHLWLERIALLHWVREGEIIDVGQMHELDGGWDQLIRAFVDRLSRRSNIRLELGGEVIAVRAHADAVEVEVRQNDDAVLSETFDHVICTAPAGATVRIDFEGFDPRSNALPSKRDALRNLSYASAGKTLMHCSKRFWELDDGIYGGSSVTDRANQQCWYPSDNAVVDEDSDNAVAVVPFDPTTDRLTTAPQPATFKARSRDVSESPGVFIAAYVWEQNARRYASLTDSQRDDLILHAVRELHPTIDTYLVGIEHMPWDAQPLPGGGAFALFAPREQRRYQEAICEPLFAHGLPRVFFAGEHTSVIGGWIQGALQTGANSALDVVEAP